MKYLKYILSVILIVSSFMLLNVKNDAILLEVNNESNAIDLKNPSIINKDNKSLFKVLLINNSTENIYIKNIEIIIKDSENNVICTFKININKTINSDEQIELEEIVNYDLSDAISFDYIIN